MLALFTEAAKSQEQRNVRAMNTKKTKPPEQDPYERDEYGIVSEKPEIRNIPGHHIGHRSRYGGGGNGYDLLPDGSYRLSPEDHESFMKIWNAKGGLRQMFRTVMEYVNEQEKLLATWRSEWFRSIGRLVYREGELDAMRYDCDMNLLTFVKRDPADSANAQPPKPSDAPEKSANAK